MNVQIRARRVPTGQACLAADGSDATKARDEEAHVIIVGGGPVGVRTAQELARLGLDTVLINAERWQPYNRVKLTPLLSGDAQLGQIMQRLDFARPGRVEVYTGQSVVDIDRARRSVTTSRGRTFAYRKLVLALGSRAHVPPIPGRDRAGVFTFRLIDDVERLLARSIRSRRTIVIGGGLLGIEAARGMERRGAETWILEHNSYLMSRQLDATAGEILRRELERSGLVIRTGVTVARIAGEDRVEAIELAGGERIACDTVIVCTGIRANIELAREVGLAVGRGIRVSERMLTSDPDIYAVGECAEHEGVIAGLVGPGFEQAIVAASDIAGKQVRYSGAVPSTKLKVANVDVFSMGDVEQLAQRLDVSTVIFDRRDAGLYRAIVRKRGHIVGAFAVGDWPDAARMQAAVRTNARLYSWQRLRFHRKGQVWPVTHARRVHDWPRQATVCNCTGATRGQIGDAIALGAASIEDIQRDTGASTVCGTCQVHLASLLGGIAQRRPIGWWKPIAAASVLGLLLAGATIWLPEWPTAHSILERGLADKLWLDGIWKQTSGYGLLAIAIAAALISVRKRMLPATWSRRFGEYAGWRAWHTAIGAAGVLALFAHTGFRLGHNFNFWLLSTFLAACISGGAMGLLAALEHRMAAEPERVARLKALALWLHILALWPLPLLLGIHILGVYFY
ncbi:MAG: FAD-dependent oxidoreductase [Hyphomicrobiaceae bacterium]